LPLNATAEKEASLERDSLDPAGVADVLSGGDLLQLAASHIAGLLENRHLRRAGNKIYRDSIDSVLSEAALTHQPIFWGK
jgi:hypothetical protein